MPTDIAWKAAASLATTGEAFQPTPLALWHDELWVAGVKRVRRAQGALTDQFNSATDHWVMYQAFVHTPEHLALGGIRGSNWIRWPAPRILTRCAL